jgi:hypothetical protein
MQKKIFFSTFFLSFFLAKKFSKGNARARRAWAGERGIRKTEGDIFPQLFFGQKILKGKRPRPACLGRRTGKAGKRGRRGAIPQAPSPEAQHTTLEPKPQKPNPKSQTPSRKPQSPNPKPQAANPKAQASKPKPQHPNRKTQTARRKPRAPNLKPQAQTPTPTRNRSHKTRPMHDTPQNATHARALISETVI